MTPAEAAEILLVRAIEESEEGPAPPEARVDALEAAGELDDERRWFARRARFLLERVYPSYAPLLAVRQALTPGLAINLGVPFLVGLLSNYLGPSEEIHILYNPIAFLLLWNLGAYLARAIGGVSFRAVRRPVTPSLRPVRDEAGRSLQELRPPERGSGALAWLLHRLAVRLWLRVHRGLLEARDGQQDRLEVGRRFLALWDPAARPLYLPATRRILDVAATGIALGAMAGMLVRGLFFEYDMVWRSTFLHDPGTIAALITIVLGPAALCTGQAMPGSEDALALMAPEGTGAARWLLLFAVSLGLFVIVPRVALAWLAGRRMGRLGARVELDLGAPYFQGVLSEAREIQVGRVKEEIRTEVQIECGKFGEAVAIFVSEQLYDRQIDPAIRRFREEGGTLAELEERIRTVSAAFEGEIAGFMSTAQRDFEESLARAVLRKLGRTLPPPGSSTSRLGPAVGAIPGSSVGQLTGLVSSQLTRPLAIAVTAAVAAVAGTVSGGFGHTLGIAIVAVLLHTSGPVGFVIGALGAVAAMGAAMWVGRERLDQGIKRVRLPGPALKIALSQSRLERLLADGRKQCRASVRELMAARLAPTTDELADQIWSRVKPLLGRAGAPLRGAGRP